MARPITCGASTGSRWARTRATALRVEILTDGSVVVTAQSRIKRFLQERFDTTPNTKLRSALEDCWITEFLTPVELGRILFMDPYPNPTSAEREELCDAATARLLSLAGL